MFNTVYDSSAALNIGLQVIGGIALTITLIIFFCKRNWDTVKSYIVFIIIGIIFFNPVIMFAIFILFGVLPQALSSVIYLKKPQEYKIQIVNKSESYPGPHNSKVTSDKDYILSANRWWNNDSSEVVRFNVSKEQYDKVYKKEYVYIKSYKGIFGFQHIYKDKDFLRPDEEANKTLKNSTSGNNVVVKKGQKDVNLNLDSRIVNYDGNVEFKPINSDWKPCEKTTFKGKTAFKTKDNSKIFIGLPMDNSVKVKSNTEIEIDPVEWVKNLNYTTTRLYNGKIIYSIAPNKRQTLRTLVSNYEIYGKSAIYQIIYSKDTKNLEVIVKSGFVNIISLNSEDHRGPGIGKSYRMIFNEEKLTSLDKINLNDYDWD